MHIYSVIYTNYVTFCDLKKTFEQSVVTRFFTPRSTESRWFVTWSATTGLPLLGPSSPWANMPNKGTSAAAGGAQDMGFVGFCGSKRLGVGVSLVVLRVLEWVILVFVGWFWKKRLKMIWKVLRRESAYPKLQECWKRKANFKRANSKSRGMQKGLRDGLWTDMNQNNGCKAIKAIFTPSYLWGFCPIQSTTSEGEKREKKRWPSNVVALTFCWQKHHGHPHARRHQALLHLNCTCCTLCLSECLGRLFSAFRTCSSCSFVHLCQNCYCISSKSTEGPSPKNFCFSREKHSQKVPRFALGPPAKTWKISSRFGFRRQFFRSISCNLGHHCFEFFFRNGLEGS